VIFSRGNTVPDTRFARPIFRDLERTGVDLTLEALSLLGLIFLVGVAAYYYPQLPDRIPSHFNFRGETDGWGGKGFLLIQPVVGVLVYTLLTVLSRCPHVFNYPWPITESNARRQYAISRQMMAAIKLVSVTLFSYITWSTIGTALGRQHGLRVEFVILVTPFIISIIGFYLFKASRAR
jgi:uncharacterized membrane protein